MERFKVINSLTLKIIAMVTMVIDHVGYMFFPSEIGFRIIGRLAFPIFCFLLVEGYNHTSNVLKYILRLFVLAMISEIPFDLTLGGGVLFNIYRQNVFFTLTIGLLAVFVIDSLQKVGKYVFCAIAAIAAMIGAELLRTDYGARGVAMILAIYIFGVSSNAWVKLFMVLSFFFLNFNGIQTYAMLALIPIYFYNGKRGTNSKLLSRAAYLIYPVHLVIIAVIRFAIV